MRRDSCMHCRLILVISRLLDGCTSVKWPTGTFPCSDFSLFTFAKQQHSQCLKHLWIRLGWVCLSVLLMLDTFGIVLGTLTGSSVTFVLCVIGPDGEHMVWGCFFNVPLSCSLVFPSPDPKGMFQLRMFAKDFLLFHLKVWESIRLCRCCIARP